MKGYPARIQLHQQLGHEIEAVSFPSAPSLAIPSRLVCALINTAQALCSLSSPSCASSPSSPYHHLTTTASPDIPIVSRYSTHPRRPPRSRSKSGRIPLRARLSNFGSSYRISRPAAVVLLITYFTTHIPTPMARKKFRISSSPSPS